MSKKLYVGNISYKATEDDVRELFSAIGEVESVKMITDAQTGHRKGFGFIEMASEDDAKKAIKDLNGSTFMERAIVVNEARPQKQRDRKSFGNQGGNYNRDRRGFSRNKGAGQRRGRT